ncbi:DUF5793 family protein [Halorientalis marina]|jgi:hypothetical protein|uniref:DUF5793 family protein n=1 Tax=Halorientalis marina TaxID=2931976 RepID=UPI001FF3FC7D|nr:DUF5793 family protein [Halorientalis marina]
MRRDYFTLHLDDLATSAEDQPTVHVDFDGPADTLEERLTLASDDVDVTYRFRTPVGADDASGVLAVTDRLTGEFVLECNADAERIFDLVDAAREFSTADADGCYEVRITHGDESVFTTEKRMLLVYDDEGSLLRQHSLIPSGVEL